MKLIEALKKWTSEGYTIEFYSTDFGVTNVNISLGRTDIYHTHFENEVTEEDIVNRLSLICN